MVAGDAEGKAGIGQDSGKLLEAHRAQCWLPDTVPETSGSVNRGDAKLCLG